MSVQIVGALLVLSLLVTPAAAAMRVTASGVWVPVLATIFAITSVVGGILLAVGGTLPISPYVTTISFAIYLRLPSGGSPTVSTRLGLPPRTPGHRLTVPTGLAPSGRRSSP